MPADVASSLRALQDQLIRDRDYYWYWDAGYAEVEFRPRPETVEELWDSEDFASSATSDRRSQPAPSSSR
jgi:hypothetical protein